MELVGDARRRPAVSSADASGFKLEGVVVDAIGSSLVVRNDLVGSDDKNDLASGVDDGNAGARGIGKAEVTFLSDGINRGDGVIRSLSLTAQNGGLYLVLLRNHLGVHVIPLALIGLQVIDETDLVLHRRESQ